MIECGHGTHVFGSIEGCRCGAWREDTKLLREDKTGKIDYSYLVELKPLVDRICQRFTEGEKKYARLNWRNCEDHLTYKQSLMRHMMQYMNGERDEDHGVAVIINMLILLDLEEQGWTTKLQ